MKTKQEQKLGPCPSGSKCSLFLDFTRGRWGFCWLVCMAISSVVPEGRISVFFIFVSIVPGVEQELNQYLPIAGGNGGSSDVESR